MPDMPEFVVQLEQASGLPWWCLLVLVVLVLIIIVLAASLSRAKRRIRTGAVDIPRGTAAPVAGNEARPENAEEDGSPALTGDEEPEPPADSENEQDEAPKAEEEAPATDGDGDVAVVPPEPSEADEDEASESIEPETPAIDEADEPEESPVADDAVDVASESVQPEVVEEQAEDYYRSPFLDDAEIAKAASGNHSRMGQSAFGIDFGFLEEYEAEYEQALSEFKRLREQADGE